MTATSQAMNLYREMASLRSRDGYPDDQLESYLVERTFPKDPAELTLRLSNVVAAFYGFILEHVGEQYGWHGADAISRKVFRELGQLKTREARERGVDVPKDSRAPAIVFITAVYSASPEYSFELPKFTPEETIIRVFGTSRYDRIAKQLGLEEHLTWPVVTPFFEGALAETGVKCSIEIDLRYLGEEGHCDCYFTFKLE